MPKRNKINRRWVWFIFFDLRIRRKKLFKKKTVRRIVCVSRSYGRRSMHYGNRVYTVYHGTKGGSLKQPSVPHRFDPHLLGPLLLVSTPAVPLADRKSFPLAPRPNNKPLTSRQSTLKTATYIRVYADTIRCWLLLATTRSSYGSISARYIKGKKCRADRGEKETEKEKEGVRGTPGEIKVLHNFTSGCVFLSEREITSVDAIRRKKR